MGDISEVLEEAFKVDGFSLVEAVEFCPSHGIKFNPGKKLYELTEKAGLLPILLENNKAPHISAEKVDGESLFTPVKEVKAEFSHNLDGRISLILAGSAGEGVQSAAELLAVAAMSCGLSVTKKGSYPVTVGVGFSLAELIISTDKIDYTGISKINAALVTSVDGLKKGLSKIENMTDGTLYLDSSLEAPETATKVEINNYRKPMGPRSASLLQAANFVKETGFIPMEAFYKALAASRISKAIPREKLEKALKELN